MTKKVHDQADQVNQKKGSKESFEEIKLEKVKNQIVHVEPTSKRVTVFHTDSISRRGGIHIFDSPIDHSKFHFYYNICMDFLIVLLIGLEVSLVLTVSMVHFTKYLTKGSGKIEEGIISLFPIFYNFIGVMWFLSAKRERVIIEKIFPDKPFLTDLFQIPIFGPFFTTLSVFVASFRQNSDHEYYERLEVSATKMRQAVTFFSSSPEAVVQLSILLMLEDDPTELWLEIATVFVAIFSVAEANVYGMVCNYFRLFSKQETDDEKEWRAIHAIKFHQKILMFLHAFFSVATNLLSRSFLTASTITYFNTMSKGETDEYGHEQKIKFSKTFIILILYFVNILARQFIFYIFRIVKHLVGKSEANEGTSNVVDGFNYGWTSTILNFDFQRKSKISQLSFYTESIFGFFIWWIVIQSVPQTQDTPISTESFWIITCIFFISFFASIILLFITKYFLSLNVVQKFVFSTHNLYSQSLFDDYSTSSNIHSKCSSTRSTITLKSKFSDSPSSKSSRKKKEISQREEIWIGNDYTDGNGYNNNSNGNNSV